MKHKRSDQITRNKKHCKHMWDWSCWLQYALDRWLDYSLVYCALVIEKVWDLPLLAAIERWPPYSGDRLDRFHCTTNLWPRDAARSVSWSDNRQCLRFLYTDLKQGIPVVILIQMQWLSQQTWWVRHKSVCHLKKWVDIQSYWTCVWLQCTWAISSSSWSFIGISEKTLFSHFSQLKIEVVKL